VAAKLHVCIAYDAEYCSGGITVQVSRGQNSMTCAPAADFFDGERAQCLTVKCHAVKCVNKLATKIAKVCYDKLVFTSGWLGSRVASVLDSEGPGVQIAVATLSVLGKLFTPIVSLFTKQQNW